MKEDTGEEERKDGSERRRTSRSLRAGNRRHILALKKVLWGTNQEGYLLGITGSVQLSPGIARSGPLVAHYY